MATLFGIGNSQAKQWVEYYFTARYALCYGCIDNIKYIVANDKKLPNSYDLDVNTNADFIVDVGSYDLYGVRDAEGGFKSDIKVRDGRSNQSIDTYYIDNGLTTEDNEPAYKWLTTISFQNAYIGNQASLGNLEFLVKRTQRHPDYTDIWYSAKADIDGDLNPAHIVYECLTQDFGLNKSAAKIGDSFTDCADILYSEGFGLSYYWNKEKTIAEFIRDVLKTIDGYIYLDKTTQKYELKLLREQTDTTGIFEISDTNGIFKELVKRSKTELGDIITDVEVEYTDVERGNIKSGVHDADAILAERIGRVNKQKYSFLGITDKKIAQKVCAREVAKGGKKRETITINCTMQADSLNNGDMFLFTYGELNYFKKPFRIIGKSSTNFLFSKYVTITAIQDLWVSANVVVSAAGSEAVEELYPSPTDTPSRVDSITYHQLSSILGDADARLKDGTETAFIHQSTPSNSFYKYRLDIDSEESLSAFSFTGSMLTDIAISKADTVISFSNAYKQSNIEINKYAYINEEIVYVTAIDYTAKTATVERGLLDTYPQEHSAGMYLYFTQGNFTYNGDYDLHENIDCKFIIISGGESLDTSLATTHNFTLDDRYYKPYPPKNIKINGEDILTENIAVAGDIDITFASRNRLTETGNVFLSYYDTSTAIEGSTENKIVAKFYQASVLQGTITRTTNTNAISISNADVIAATSGVATDEYDAEVVISAIRNGVSSWQSIQSDITCTIT